MELLAVLAVLLILGALVVPTLSGMRGNGYQKAAADELRARIADARSLAMNDCIPYRIAIHQDGTRVRFAPDGMEFATQPASDVPGGSVKSLESHFENATVAVVSPDLMTPAPIADGTGWITIATFLPDGSSDQDKVLMEVREDNFPPLQILLRGVTGGTQVVPPSSQGGNQP